LPEENVTQLVQPLLKLTHNFDKFVYYYYQIEAEFEERNTKLFGE